MFSINPTANNGYTIVGLIFKFKVCLVLGSSVLNRYIWLTKSPTDAKPRDVTSNVTQHRGLKRLNLVQLD